VHAASCAEVDAMVGAHITSEAPRTHWEDSHAHLRCATFEEALEAMRDPYFQSSAPLERGPETLLREVHVYREYSTNLDLAWEVVEKLSPGNGPLHIRREGNRWTAAFGEHLAATAASAPLAICLAGLLASGIAVDLEVPT
jgi:hypothetical protein